jgi:hypothetical protein
LVATGIETRVGPSWIVSGRVGSLADDEKKEACARAPRPNRKEPNEA